MVLLVPLFGLYGAAIGPLAATCLVGLPNNLRTLAREEGTSTRSVVAMLTPWLVRMAVLLVGLTVFVFFNRVHGLTALAVASIGVAVAYVAIMTPILLRPPIGPMLRAGIQPWISPGSLREAVGTAAGHPE
jgi:hypothetical protein